MRRLVVESFTTVAGIPRGYPRPHDPAQSSNSGQMDTSNRRVLGQMTTAQETLSDLGLSLRTAFRGAVQEELSPTLAAITTMCDRVQAQNQSFCRLLWSPKMLGSRRLWIV